MLVWQLVRQVESLQELLRRLQLLDSQKVHQAIFFTWTSRHVRSISPVFIIDPDFFGGA
jgi:hypothetical protein